MALFFRESLQKLRVLVPHILDMPQPIIDKAQPAITQRGQHTATAVMPDNKDVPYFQHLHGELDDGETVQVRMHDYVRYVAMNEYFTGQKASDLIGGNAGVRTTNP